MSSSNDTFLFISDIGWTAICSIATVLAVIIALYLPYFERQRIRKNIIKLLNNDFKKNADLLKKAYDTKETNINGNLISKINMMCPVLKMINLDVWENHKNSLAEISPVNFLRYNNINSLIQTIKNEAIEIDNTKGQSPFIGIIEHEISTCINNSDFKFIINN